MYENVILLSLGLVVVHLIQEWFKFVTGWRRYAIWGWFVRIIWLKECSKCCLFGWIFGCSFHSFIYGFRVTWGWRMGCGVTRFFIIIWVLLTSTIALQHHNGVVWFYLNLLRFHNGRVKDISILKRYVNLILNGVGCSTSFHTFTHDWLVGGALEEVLKEVGTLLLLTCLDSINFWGALLNLLGSGLSAHRFMLLRYQGYGLVDQFKTTHHHKNDHTYPLSTCWWGACRQVAVKP